MGPLAARCARTRSVAAACMLLVLLFAGQAQAGWVTGFCDNFDAQITGGHPSNWTTVEQAAPNTVILVDTSQYHGYSGKSVRFIDTVDAAGCWLSRSPSPGAQRFAVEWWQRQASTLDSLGLEFWAPGALSGVSPFRAVGLDPGLSGYLGWFVYFDAAGPHALAPFAPGTWYRVRCEVDCATQTFNLSVWDSVGSVVGQVSAITLPGTVSSVASYDFFTGGAAQTPSGVWIDDVCEQTWAPDTTPPQTWITSGPCGGTVCYTYTTFCFSGSDDQTPTGSLRYYWRLDGGSWQGGTTSTCAYPSGLPSGSHYFEVYAVDSAGNPDPSPASCTFNADTAAPSVSITYPYSGQTVRCTVTIAATASDVTGINRVQFYINGYWRASDYSAPYQYVWNTTGSADGPATILARAYDICGRSADYYVYVTVDNTTFNDVSKTDWFWAHVEAIVARGITGGCSGYPPLYCPMRNVTRGEMAVFLCRAAGKSPLYPGVPTFADVPTSHPYYGWIERLANAASWGGNPPTVGCYLAPQRLFCPWNPVLREEMAAFLVRAMGKLPMSSCAGIFCDVPRGGWACPYIERLANAGSWSCGAPTTGIVCPPGYSGWCRCFGPKDYVTRAQMAAFLVRAFCIPAACQ